jgi:hypothetical protein
MARKRKTSRGMRRNAAGKQMSGSYGYLQGKAVDCINSTMMRLREMRHSSTGVTLLLLADDLQGLLSAQWAIDQLYAEADRGVAVGMLSAADANAWKAESKRLSNALSRVVLDIQELVHSRRGADISPHFVSYPFGRTADSPADDVEMEQLFQNGTALRW